MTFFRLEGVIDSATVRTVREAWGKWNLITHLKRAEKSVQLFLLYSGLFTYTRVLYIYLRIYIYKHVYICVYV